MTARSAPTDTLARARGRVGGLTTILRHGAGPTAARARSGLWAKFVREADPEGKLPESERNARARVLQELHYARMTLARIEARKAKKAATEVASVAASTIEDHGNDVDRAA